jgi:hypothetical protein
VEAALPEFEEYVVAALAGHGDLTREDIRAVMHVEGEVGPHWTPPQPLSAEEEPELPPAESGRGLPAAEHDEGPPAAERDPHSS